MVQRIENWDRACHVSLSSTNQTLRSLVKNERDAVLNVVILHFFVRIQSLLVVYETVPFYTQFIGYQQVQPRVDVEVAGNMQVCSWPAVQDEVWRETCSPVLSRYGSHKGSPKTLKRLVNRALVELAVLITHQVDKRDYKHHRKLNSPQHCWLRCFKAIVNTNFWREDHGELSWLPWSSSSLVVVCYRYLLFRHLQVIITRMSRNWWMFFHSTP